jgi:adenylate cyclase
MMRCKEHFEAGSKLYLAQKWDEAVAEFKKALEANPEDGPSKIYIDRCEEFKTNPPEQGAAWDGVYTMTTK